MQISMKLSLARTGHLNAILVEDVEGNWSSLTRVEELQELMSQLDVKVGLRKGQDMLVETDRKATAIEQIMGLQRHMSFYMGG